MNEPRGKSEVNDELLGETRAPALSRTAGPRRQAPGNAPAILDEFVPVTGYDRKYAIRLLLGPIQLPQPIRRPRAAHYGAAGGQRATAHQQPGRRG
jgi:hypothetical protein